MTSTVEVKAREGVTLRVRQVRPNTNQVFAEDELQASDLRRIYSVHSGCTLVISEIQPEAPAQEAEQAA